MRIGKVVGSLWATRKTESTTGMKFLIVQPYVLSKETDGEPVVAADILGAGEGELVILAHGKAARLAAGNENMSIDAAVTGIIDEYEVKPECYSGDLDPEKISYKKALA